MTDRRTPPQRSLKARALQWLAQREHSRAELRRKLLAHARAAARAAVAVELAADPARQGGPADAEGAAAVDLPGEVDAALDWLEAHRYLSQERFVESRVHARAARFGNLRIHQELKQHAVALSADAFQALKASEFDRARDVWSRKFPAAAAGPAERARQARFLAGRGFSPEVIRRVLRSGPSPHLDDALPLDDSTD